jgi:hypothetical protein
MLTQLTNEQIERMEKYKEKLEQFNSQEGLMKAQIIISMSESMGLMLKKYPTAKEMWNALVAEVTKKLKIVLTSVQRQLCNIKCSDKDDLHEHLDKAQDLYAHLKKMGATSNEEEFIDIILSSLPPSYESVMNALMTSLKECNKPIKPNKIIRVLKAQYDKRKTLGNSQDNQVFMSKQAKGSSKK